MFIDTHLTQEEVFREGHAIGHRCGIAGSGHVAGERKGRRMVVKNFRRQNAHEIHIFVAESGNFKVLVLKVRSCCSAVCTCVVYGLKVRSFEATRK